MNILAHIETLKQQAAQFSSQLAETERHSRDTLTVVRRAKRRVLYYRFARALREPAKDYSLWFPGVLVVGFAFAAALAFVFLFLVGLSSTTIAIGMLVSAVAMLILLAMAISRPATVELPAFLEEQLTCIRQHKQELDRINTDAKKLREQILSTKATINELAESDRLKRQLLLKENWKTLEGAQWQEYLVKVFEALGASAQTARTSGEEGVDLIVRFGEIMIAVQTKGYVGSVGKEAVQQVVAGKVHYGCDRAAVITNSRFTAPARSIAMGQSCFLIGEQEFPAFVMGSNLEMFR
ncbi:restriction endonuclease [Bythopirellula polymerisocia]|uniref:Restriction endonuclease n=1 Tax=Bythopirellula polymerisocia TaxID=2528003 RepID=A0A5C6CCM6_9BACT|nr:restriction endonuclease [Bythopirellula polymerisocia]TWU21958.1 Restriction endonuclease [Bythopirellula polymerisocia]